jgi:hypothetical protein
MYCSDFCWILADIFQFFIFPIITTLRLASILWEVVLAESGVAELYNDPAIFLRHLAASFAISLLLSVIVEDPYKAARVAYFACLSIITGPILGPSSGDDSSTPPIPGQFDPPIDPPTRPTIRPDVEDDEDTGFVSPPPDSPDSDVSFTPQRPVPVQQVNPSPAPRQLSDTRRFSLGPPVDPWAAARVNVESGEAYNPFRSSVARAAPPRPEVTSGQGSPVSPPHSRRIVTSPTVVNTPQRETEPTVRPTQRPRDLRPRDRQPSFPQVRVPHVRVRQPRVSHPRVPRSPVQQSPIAPPTPPHPDVEKISKLEHALNLLKPPCEAFERDVLPTFDAEDLQYQQLRDGLNSIFEEAEEYEMYVSDQHENHIDKIKKYARASIEELHGLWTRKKSLAVNPFFGSIGSGPAGVARILPVLRNIRQSLRRLESFAPFGPERQNWQAEVKDILYHITWTSHYVNLLATISDEELALAERGFSIKMPAISRKIVQSWHTVWSFNELVPEISGYLTVAFPFMANVRTKLEALHRRLDEKRRAGGKREWPNTRTVRFADEEPHTKIGKYSPPSPPLFSPMDVDLPARKLITEERRQLLRQRWGSSKRPARMSYSCKTLWMDVSRTPVDPLPDDDWEDL